MKQQLGAGALTMDDDDNEEKENQIIRQCVFGLILVFYAMIFVIIKAIFF